MSSAKTRPAREVPQHVLEVPLESRTVRLADRRRVFVEPVSALRIRELKAVRRMLSNGAADLELLEDDISTLQDRLSAPADSPDRDASEQLTSGEAYRRYFFVDTDGNSSDPVQDSLDELVDRRTALLERFAAARGAKRYAPVLQREPDIRWLEGALQRVDEEVRGQVLLRGFAALTNPDLRAVALRRFEGASRLSQKVPSEDRLHVLAAIGEESLSLETEPLMTTPQIQQTWRTLPHQQQFKLSL